VSLVSRYLETNGLSTVVLGCARDIVEECDVARFVFTDFPLGNPCGKPWDAEMQRSIVKNALTLLERAWIPRTTVQTPFYWGNDAWRDAFMQVNEDNREALICAGKERRQARAQRKAGL
jgi:D-proline reductase (dithiol) PrdB